MKLGSETGSLVNHVASTSKQPIPTVGMGCTILMWSDRHAATVVEIKSARRIVIQQDNAERTDKNGMSESQEYTYTPNTNAAKRVFFLNKRGRWVEQGGGNGLLLGQRIEFYDFTH